jgi:hypothetical protein
MSAPARWNVVLLRDGIQRVVRNHPEGSGAWLRVAWIDKAFLAPLAFLAFQILRIGGETLP